MDDLEYHFPREVQAIRYAVRIIAVDHCFPEPRVIPGSPISQTARGDGAAGMKGCQGTPWSEELDAEELYGAAGGDYDLEPRGSIFSCIRSQLNPSKHPQIMWFYAGFKGVGVFFVIPCALV